MNILLQVVTPLFNALSQCNGARTPGKSLQGNSKHASITAFRVGNKNKHSLSPQNNCKVSEVIHCSKFNRVCYI